MEGSRIWLIDFGQWHWRWFGIYIRKIRAFFLRCLLMSRRSLGCRGCDEEYLVISWLSLSYGSVRCASLVVNANSCYMAQVISEDNPNRKPFPLVPKSFDSISSARQQSLNSSVSRETRATNGYTIRHIKMTAVGDIHTTENVLRLPGKFDSSFSQPSAKY